MLSSNDIKSPTLLAAKLRNQKDYISYFLFDEFSSPTQNQLLSYHESQGPPSSKLMATIVQDINLVLKKFNLVQEFDRLNQVLKYPDLTLENVLSEKKYKDSH